ncbi:hypothetical protein DRQ36_04080 [bacterium]|nr:MAG: hypothetical protein DRQ36_04080 [bacterium]
MTCITANVTAKTPRLVYFGVFLWAFLAAYLSLFPNIRLFLPFLVFTTIILLLIPFRVSFSVLVVFALAHTPGYGNIFQFRFAGWNILLLEVITIFIFLQIIIESLVGRIRFRITPMLIVIGMFFLSSVIQLLRGIYLGYDPSQLRSAGRAIVYFSYIIPIAAYYASGGTPRKLINLMLIGWGFALIHYFMKYFGIIFPAGASGTARMIWPPISNVIWFLPLILMYALIKGVRQYDRKTYLCWFLLVVSCLVLLPTQARSIYLALFVEFVLLLSVVIAIQKKGERVVFVFRLLVITVVGVALAYFLLKFLMGEKFDLLISNVMLRFRTLGSIRRDLPIASRIYQIYESIKLLKGHWVFGRGLGIEWHSLINTGYFRIDNLYFTILVNQGLIGLGLYFAILALWMQRGIYLVNNSRLIKDNIVLAFSLVQPLAVLSILVSGMAGPAYYLSTPNIILMLLWAMTTEVIYSKVRPVKMEHLN